ncbi:hypothetical protein X271_00560 [Candidatus Hepatoplasma crinochetorum Av]|uniref:Uncharacterized protein n=1 Tax=Candidatus Hepatoplasma crinochetorum Av TaxID=1427984 RepID=W8GTA2_9MOLU|nr:hypothetical protein [Candidatus Hepatoplasma crinochetorum]AHK22660.1 hypothetical protein X271_00560 [Candidatus Hepatoplasma crinochetorum Av]
MIKILIPKNNTNWESDDTNLNKNVIDFPGNSKEESIAKRNEFVNYVLFDDQIDFLNLENGYWIEKNIRINNIENIELKININDYFFEEDINKKRELILNLNNIIIYENNLFKFYSISEVKNLDNNNFILILNLDIYITYPISTILKGETFIERAHLDRNNQSLQVREDFSLKLSNVEEISTNFKYGNDVINNSIIWIIGVFKSSNPIAKIGNFSLNYDFYLYPINKEKNNITIINGVSVQKTFQNDLSKEEFAGFYILESPIFPDKFSLTKDEVGNLVIKIIEGNDEYLSITENKFLIKEFILKSSMGSTDEINLDHNFFNFPSSYLNDKDINFEHKLFAYPFQYYIIETINGNSSIEYDPLQLGISNKEKQKIKLNFTFSLNPWTHNCNIYFENFSNEDYTDYSKHWNSNQYSVVVDNEYPQRTESFYEIFEKSKSKTRSGFLLDSVEISIGMAEIATGYIEKKPKIMWDGIKKTLEGGAKLTIDAKNYLTNLENEIIPYRSSKISGDLFTSYFNKEQGYSWRLYKYSLNRNEEKSLWDYFYQYGYKLAVLSDIKDYLNSRYWFNFIKASEVFNIVDKDLSDQIKLKIDKDFIYGITFWHYRNKETWNGIRHYNKENLEMNYIN